MGNAGGFSPVGPSTPVRGLGPDEQGPYHQQELSETQLQEMARNFEGKKITPCRAH